MKLKVHVSFRQYLKLLLSLAYHKPVLKILVCVAILVFAWILFYHLEVFGLPEPAIYQYITLLLIAVVQPIAIIYTIHRNYHSSNYLREPLDMELTDSEVKMTGETFVMQIFWSKVYKVDERQNWFLIYLNNLSAIIIPKKDLADEQITYIRKILKNVPTDQ